MKIISWNVNGIRAVYKKGFLEWFKHAKADIVCLNEVKAHKNDIPKELLSIKGYYAFFSFAQKKGYSGVAIYTKKKPVRIFYKMGFKKFDSEGRFIRLDYAEFILLALYLPYGGRSKENLDYKLKAYEHLFKYLKKLKGKKVILAGDFNIAHKEIDLARPKQNHNNIMFTPLEREQISKLISLDFEDTFRKFNSKGENYTWWPYFANARERNLGWRIDYVFVSKNLVSKLKKSFIWPEVTGSDHCPVGIELR